MDAQPGRTHPVRRHLLVLGLFVAATLVMTWPTAREAARGVPDLGDPLADAWILAWGSSHIARLDFRAFRPDSTSR